jgi:hypothetical protein
MSSTQNSFLTPHQHCFIAPRRLMILYLTVCLISSIAEISLGSYSDREVMVKGIFNVLSSCIGVVIPFESCLMTNLLQNLLATQRISFDLDHCTFPTFADGEMKMILSDAIKSCNHNNDIVTTVDFITTNFEVIFRNDICLKAACKEVKGFSKKIESAIKEEYIAVKNKFLEVTSYCSGEKFSINDCAVSSALDLLFQGTHFLQY